MDELVDIDLSYLLLLFEELDMTDDVSRCASFIVPQSADGAGRAAEREH